MQGCRAAELPLLNRRCLLSNGIFYPNFLPYLPTFQLQANGVLGLFKGYWVSPTVVYPLFISPAFPGICILSLAPGTSMILLGALADVKWM